MEELQNEWIQVPILYYEDKEFGSRGKLRISINEKITNKIYFTPSNIIINIYNEYNKFVQLSIIDVIDLLRTFTDMFESIKSMKDNQIKVQRSYGNNTSSLYFEVSNKKDISKILVEISIIKNTTDFSSIFMELTTFKGIYNILRSFIESYSNTCVMMNMLYHLKGIRTNISDGISSSTTKNITNIISSEKQDEIPSEGIYGEFSDFVGEKFSNISTSEIDKVSEKILNNFKEEIKEDEEDDLHILYNIFDGNLNNLLSFLSSMDVEENPLKRLNDYLLSNSEGNINLFEGIEKENIKYLSFTTKVIVGRILKLIIEEKMKSIPKNILYVVDLMEDQNTITNEFITGLFISLIYIKIAKERLTEKDNDLTTNCSLDFMRMVGYLNPFIFSYLKNLKSKDAFLNVAISSFKGIKEKGFFNSLDKTIEIYNCKSIEEYEVIDNMKNFLNLSDQIERNVKEIIGIISSVEIKNPKEISEEEFMKFISPIEIYLSKHEIKEKNLSIELFKKIIGDTGIILEDEKIKRLYLGDEYVNENDLKSIMKDFKIEEKIEEEVTNEEKKEDSGIFGDMAKEMERDMKEEKSNEVDGMESLLSSFDNI